MLIKNVIIFKTNYDDESYTCNIFSIGTKFGRKYWSIHSKINWNVCNLKPLMAMSSHLHSR